MELFKGHNFYILTQREEEPKNQQFARESLREEMLKILRNN